MKRMLLSWALTSGFLILAVIALRAALGKRMGAGLRYALWGLVLLRLLVPVQLFTSPIVGMQLSDETQSTYRVTDTGPKQGGITPADPAEDNQTGLFSPPDLPALPDAPEPPQAPDWTKLPAALGWVWLGGSVVMAVVLLGCNLSFWLRLRRTRKPLEEQRAHDVCSYTALPVYTASGLPSPCLFGVFRPAIYVAPETAADPDALRHVLAHEGTHFRHGDHIWSLLRCAALAVHWWNPLVWLAARLSRRDGELACDEGALKRLGDGERAAYGNTLLALMTAKAAPGGLLTCSTAMTGDKKSLKERFARIARAPKRAVGIAAAAVALGLLMTVCAFGQRTAEKPASWEELDADLSLTVDDDGTVRITGMVDGLELPRGAFWYPDSLLSGSPYGELSLVYPPFTDGIEGFFNALWTDESRTAVDISTWMMASLSSYAPCSYWDFTVDFSDGGAKVTRMEESVIWDPPDGMEVRLYPKTISDEEAVRAGRIAARLLTAAEEYYRDREEKGNAPAETPEPSEPPAPSEDQSPTGSARAALKAALLGETDFTFYDEQGRPTDADIHTAPPVAFDSLSDEWGMYDSFTVVDLDGDGLGEVVYHVTDVAGDAGGYLILRWVGIGDIRCYARSLHTTRELKADGSFDFGYLGAVGSARLSFPEPGTMYREEPFLVASSPTSMDLDAEDAAFLIGGETVTREEFDAAWEEQHRKPDAVWYDFTKENIKKVMG